MDATNFNDRVAGEVRAAAARRRMSGTQLARLIGVSQVAMSRRLNGRMAFRVDELAILAEALDVPISDLLPVTRASRAELRAAA